MATSTYGSYLMYGSTPAKLCDIKSYPDLLGTPEMLDTTTMSDKARTGVPGLQNQEVLTFTANYDESVASNVQTTLTGLVGTEEDYAVYFGEASGTPNGKQGKFTFKGYLNWHLLGKGVNEVREIEITIIPTTDIEYTAPVA